MTNVAGDNTWECLMFDVELASGTIEYVDTGGSRPVIVFLHGLLTSGSLWRHVVAELRPDYR